MIKLIQFRNRGPAHHLAGANLAKTLDKVPYGLRGGRNGRGHVFDGGAKLAVVIAYVVGSSFGAVRAKGIIDAGDEPRLAFPAFGAPGRFRYVEHLGVGSEVQNRRTQFPRLALSGRRANRCKQSMTIDRVESRGPAYSSSCVEGAHAPTFVQDCAV